MWRQVKRIGQKIKYVAVPMMAQRNRCKQEYRKCFHFTLRSNNAHDTEYTKAVKAIMPTHSPIASRMPIQMSAVMA